MEQFTETIYGKIPSSWQMIPSSTFCMRITDGTHDSPKEQNIGKYLITSKHIKGRNIDFENAYFINEDDFNKINLRSKVDQWDVIISMIGEYCGFSYLERNEIIDYAVKNVGILKTGNQHKAFWLYYFLNSKNGKFILDSNKSGTSQPYLTLSFLRDFPVLYPKHQTEAEIIIDVLSSLDDKIDLLNRQNKTLETIAETLFRQSFIEEADEKWDEIKIKDINVIITDYVANGSFASLAQNVKYKLEPDYAILIRLTDFNNNFEGDFVYVDEHAYKFLNKSNLIGGEVIISNVGAYAGTVFKCPNLDRPMTLGPNAIVLKSQFNNFFYLFFKSKYGKYLLDGIISGSAQPKFNKTNFRDIVIKLPAIDYLSNFEKLVNDYFIKIDFNTSQIRTLTRLRDTLLPKLMSGEVRVNL